MIRTYQEMERIKEVSPPSYDTAIILTVGTNGYQLTLATGNTQKYYKAINGTYAVGQKVKVQKVNGTYLIIGKF